MHDLISRKALLAEYDRVHIGPPGGARKLMEDAPAVNAVPIEKYNELKERCEKWKEIADILDTALRQYQRQYGE